MGLANWLKSPVLVSVFLQKNDNLGELGHQEFIAFLVVDWVCYRFVTVRGAAHGEFMGLNSVGDCAWKYDRENDGSGVRSSQLVGAS